MKKTVYLLSNAHLDPVWQWEWEEGAAAAVSTFRVAADLCEEYDGFVFNHNEALLYKWVEEWLEEKPAETLQEIVGDALIKSGVMGNAKKFNADDNVEDDEAGK